MQGLDDDDAAALGVRAKAVSGVVVGFDRGFPIEFDQSRLALAAVRETAYLDAEVPVLLAHLHRAEEDSVVVRQKVVVQSHQHAVHLNVAAAKRFSLFVGREVDLPAGDLQQSLLAIAVHECLRVAGVEAGQVWNTTLKRHDRQGVRTF